MSAFPSHLKDMLLKPSTVRTLADVPVPSTPSVACPESVPFVMWSSLRAMFNDSQLAAMLALVTSLTSDPDNSLALDRDRDRVERGGAIQKENSMSTGQDTPFPMMLLQGPPGTGKTHTVLGMISLLLALGVPGAGQKKGGKKVRISP